MLLIFVFPEGKCIEDTITNCFLLWQWVKYNEMSTELFVRITGKFDEVTTAKKQSELRLNLKI